MKRRRGPLSSIAPADMKPWALITSGTSAELMIYDEISWWGVDAKELATEISELTVDTIKVRINSPGGDAFDGVAIYSTLKNHPASILVQVDGLAASAASIIAMAGDRIEINPGAMLMIHDAWGFTMGNAADHDKTAEMLNKLSDSMSSIYCTRSGTGTPQTWRAAMQAESWYTADEAIAAGLADAICGETPEDASAITDPGMTPDAGITPDEDVMDGCKPRKSAADQCASWDLSQYRYQGRENAPTPEIKPKTSAMQQHDGPMMSRAEFVRAIRAGYTGK